MSARKTYTSLLFYLSALEGAAVIVALLSIPSEGGTLSRARLALITIAFLLGIGWIYASSRFSGDLNGLARPRFILLFALLALTFSLLLFLLRYLDPGRFLSAYQRLSPLLWYFFAICIQLAVYLLYLYSGFHVQNLSLRRPIYSYALIAVVILLFVYIFVAVTRLGVTFDPAYWGEPGVPLIGWQFGLALIGGLVLLCVGQVVRSHRLDIALPILIYAMMVAICLSVPLTVLKNSFYMPITSPAQIPFPYADSAYYDQMAQSLLIGHPYQGVIPTRPLYILFLTILHMLFGQDYQLILVGQTFVLAIIPVLLYYLGKKLHSRSAGLVIALFFIFREFTSLLISSQTRVTNTKMILVDLPTLLLLLLACLFVFRWLERKELIGAFAAGGAFGLLLLLRAQSLFILPFIILIAFLVLGWRNRSFYRHTLLFMVGVAISVLPWLTHNYLLTGAFAFDAAFENKLLVSQYVYQGNAAIQNLNVEGMSLPRMLIEFALRDPQHVFGFITNHFLATQVNGLLALPLIERYDGLLAPVNLYWMNFEGHLTWYNALLLIVYLVVISIGFGAAWKRWRWLGVLPLMFSIGYALATAASRFSSWRYDYPADWIWYFHFGIGSAEILSQLAVLFGARHEMVFIAHDHSAVTSRSSAVPKSVALALLFVLIGASPWMITKLSAPRYADQSVEHLESQILSLYNAPTKEEITEFTSQPNTFFEAGRFLYPRFFRKNTGLSSANPSPAFAVRDYPRLGFLLLNQKSTPAVLPTEQMFASVPHGADVIVLGCKREDYVEVRLLAVPQLARIYLSAPLSEPCP
jgi:4-amino-4-deoxy-L-arabinose transferase-like glycosyltransferase